MQSIHYIIGYLKGRIDWYKRNAPDQDLVISELQCTLDAIKGG